MCIPQSVEEILDVTGLSLERLYQILGRDTYDSSIFKLSDQKHMRFCELFDRLEAARRSSSKSVKGEALERIVGFLLESLGVYRVLRNRRTSTNEIDVLLLKNHGFDYIDAERFPRTIMCECKNYGGSVSVTYIGKFFALAHMANCKLGLMFSYKPISGRNNWVDGKGMCRKIALRSNTFIINITYSDLMLIRDKNVSIMRIIDDKRMALENDIDIQCEQHELCHDAQFVNADIG